MAFARDVYTATGGQTDFTITFPYQAEEDVLVSQNGSTLTQTTDYTFPDATTIRLVTGATNGDTVVLQRSTSQSSRDVDFTAGTLTEADLDNSAIQMFYMAQESIDIANIKLGKASDEIWDAESIRIKNLGTPTASTDAVTKSYVDTLAISGTAGTPVAIADGGTGASTASAALDNLGAGTVGKAVFQDTTAAAVRTEISAQEDVITTQGDIVQGGVGGAAERLAVGASGTVPQSDGTNLAFAYLPGFQAVQIFTASGTWTKPTGLKRVIVEVVGGGGGSGGRDASTASTTVGAGGGGGGGYSMKVIEAASLGATETVTIGAAGTAGSTSGSAGTDAGDGGDTTFGAHCTGGGGSGSERAQDLGSERTGYQGGAGGTGSGGDLNIPGGAGEIGLSFNSGNSPMGGKGGASRFSGSGRNSASTSVGEAGQLYGGGASGGCSANSQSAGNGSAGAAGLCIVWEFY